jgi:hypothetical protein
MFYPDVDWVGPCELVFVGIASVTRVSATLVPNTLIMYTILDVDCVGPCELDLVLAGTQSSDDSVPTILVPNFRSESR